MKFIIYSPSPNGILATHKLTLILKLCDTFLFELSPKIDFLLRQLP